MAIAFDRPDVPQVVLSTFLPTAQAGDRIALEPYHVAAEIASSRNAGALGEAEATIGAGRARQDRYAADGLRAIVKQLRDAGYSLSKAALLVNRAGWVNDLLRYSLATPSHPPVAEGLAVRDALRSALRENEIEFIEVDEKSLLADPRLNACRSTLAGPWRKEHRLACLAAWTS